MDAFFEPDAVASDRLYATYARPDWPPAIEARAYIESIWPRVAPFLDADFREKIKHSFEQHFWELYLAASLIEAGLDLVPRAERGGGDEGPDFLLRDGTAIEAIWVTKGDGPDAVPEREVGTGAYSVPDDAIQLRLLHAVETKRRVLERYIEKGIHPVDKPFIIAVNGRGVTSPGQESVVPRIVRVLHAIGHMQIHLDRNSLEMTGRSFSEHTGVQKTSGATVPANAFLSGTRFQHVSAVLYSCVDAVNRPTKNGADFILVHNSNASCPVPIRHLPAHLEYVVDGEVVREVSGSAPVDV